MRSALGIAIGLAARAEVTLFDEPYAGLGAVARRIFSDRLLTDYAEFPRTILLSTHLVDEAASAVRTGATLGRRRPSAPEAANLEGVSAWARGSRSPATAWSGRTSTWR